MAEKKKEMMMGGGVEVEDGGVGFINNSFDFSEKNFSSLGFMGVQDYLPRIHYNNNNNNNSHDDIKPGDTPEFAATTRIECSDDQVLNHHHQQPPTPNSSSISSASTSDPMHHDDDHDDDEQHKTNNLNNRLKVKKTNQKRQREARFAFMTKSEVDHLEDGYRWRKYGQKAVKNSPFPRSYYRCTTASCNVTKRVERSLNDPTIVVTTYEGQHKHPTPVMAARSSPFHGSSPIPPAGAVASLMPENCYLPQYYHHHLLQQQQQLLFFNTLSSLGLPPSKINNNFSSVLLTDHDHGLLQDVVPSHMLKEE